MSNVKSSSTEFIPFNCETSKIVTYQCKSCEFQTILLIILKKHIEIHHSLKAQNNKDNDGEYLLHNYICKKCGFQTNSGLNWFQHAQKCPKVISEDFHFHYEENLLKVRQVYTTDVHSDSDSFSNCGYKIYNCDCCNYKSTHKYDVTQHKISKHSNDEVTWFKCEECAYKGKYRGHLKQHMRLTHLKEFENRTHFQKNFNCIQCSFSTIDKTTLKRHIINKHVSGNEIRWYECAKCSYKAKQKCNLKLHIHAVHFNEKKLKCEVGSYKTNSKQSFEKHIKNSHFSENDCNEKNFKCDVCLYQTNLKQSLKEHIKNRHWSENEVVWWLCQECPYKSDSKENLQLHEKAEHAEEKNMKIDIQKKFRLILENAESANIVKKMKST